MYKMSDFKESDIIRIVNLDNTKQDGFQLCARKMRRDAE